MAVTCDILYLHEVHEGGRNDLHIRVVRWNGGEPQLEKREVYEKEGELRNGKAKGFTLEELQSAMASEKVLAALHGEKQQD